MRRTSRSTKIRILTCTFLGALVTCTEDRGRVTGLAQETATNTQTPASSAASVVLVGAGDIAVCGSSRDEATAALLDTIPGTVFTAGDNAYPDGSATNFSQCYEPSWGRHKSRTFPSPGNHDYHIQDAADYFAYFGSNAGPAGRGYYSYDIGDWHVVSLNSNIDRTTNSPQVTWLRADLAASTRQCTVAYWHHARFSSGTQHGSNTSIQPMWQALYDAGAELVIAGHEHNYERFAPQTPAGLADSATGIREFVVGTGGASLYPNFTPIPNSEVRNGTTSGVLKLTLDAGTYSWQFIPIAGQTFADTGSGVCHGPPGGSGVSASQSTVSAAPASIVAGSASSTITVTARDGTGSPMSGVTVVLSATGSGNAITQPTGTTNSSGVATGTLSSTVAGQKTVSATGNGFGIAQTASVTVTAGPLSTSQSTVTASPATVAAGGGSSTITVTAKDGFGNPISGATVVLAATGSGNALTQPAGPTNASGVATGSLGSTVAETKTVSATINSAAITQTATVSVTPPGSGATITHALLAAGSNAANLKNYTTASIAPAPNALITVAVRNQRSPAAISPTLSGGGMTSWTQVASVDYDSVSVPQGRLTVFRAMSASPGSGPITITFSSSVANVDWIVSQWTGVDQSGTNGSGAIGQTGSARGDAVTALSVPLAAFGNANNVAYGAVGARRNAPAITPGSGFTEIAEVTPGENTLLEAQWATNLNTIQASIVSAKNAALLGIEIRAGAGGPPPVSASQSTVAAAPTQITAGSGTSTITVTAKDGSGNPISGASVALAATGGSNNLTQAVGTTDGSGQATGTLSSTLAQDKVVSATINGFAINQTATVIVTAAAPAALAFTTQPSNTGANAPITPAVVVEIRDQHGNRVNSSGDVTMAIGANPASGTLSGTITQAAVGGVATFSNLAINNTGTDYTLVAGSSGVPNVTSSAFTITPPVPSASLSTASANPTSFTAGGSSTITVTVQDGSGAPMSDVTVTLSATGSGNSITQPSSPTDINGQTTGMLTSTGAGSKTVTAVAGGVTLNQQPVVTVNAGSPDAGQSTVAATPTSITTSGSSTLTVTVKDQFGNPVNGSNVVLSATGTGNTLTGGGATNVSGVATGTFSSTVAEPKIVSATADGTPITQTASVTVTPPPPTVSASLSTVVAAPTSFTAGGSSTITITVKDGSGTPMSGVAVTLSATGNSNSITQPASATDVNGVTTGTLGSTGAGSKTVTAVAGGVTLNQQPGVTVTAGPAHAGQSTVGAAPTSITAGSGSSTLTVTVKDQFGNPVNGSNVVLSATGTGNTLTGGGATNVSGVATGTFSSTVAEPKIVSATADGTPITQTATVTVTPPGSGGTIAHTLLTAGRDSLNLRVYTTASISPAPNTLVTVAVLNHQGTAAAPSPTVTGGGMAAWEIVGSVTFFGTTPLKRLTIYRAMSAAPGSGPITITSSVTVANCQWIVSQWSGVDASGANGAGAIGLTGSTMGTAVTSLTLSLAAFASANNVAFGVFGIGSSSAIATAGSGFTTIAQQPSGEGTTGDLFAEWAVNRNSITATWPAKDAGALGVEIKAGTGP